MFLDEIFYECEVVYADEDGNILSEAAVRQYKRFGSKIKKQFRCTSGPKKGKIVASSASCSKRKEPRRVRLGRKIARTKKGIRILKSKISKRKSMSKFVSRMNKRLRRK